MAVDVPVMFAAFVDSWAAANSHEGPLIQALRALLCAFSHSFAVTLFLFFYVAHCVLSVGRCC